MFGIGLGIFPSELNIVILLANEILAFPMICQKLLCIRSVKSRCESTGFTSKGDRFFEENTSMSLTIGSTLMSIIFSGFDTYNPHFS